MPRTDQPYPPGSWTVDRVRRVLEETNGRGELPTYDDGDRWQEIATDPTTGPYAGTIVERAMEFSDDRVPPLPASLYADYTRTGNRPRYERPYFGRGRRLGVLALAECLEREGRFLDDVLDHAWAICEQTTWLLPAHLPEEERTDGLPSLRDPADHHVALFSARTAHLLAEVDYLLNDRLHPALRRRLRTEIDDRVLTPFESRDDFHWQEPPAGNWTAVCNAGAVIAAVYLEEDLDRLARLVVQAAHGLEHYLASFGTDGCSPEGLSYWNFGFSHYAMLATVIEARTEGRLSLLSPEILPEIARFPLRIELSPGRYVLFSDSREGEDVDPYLACWAGTEFDVPELVATGRRAFSSMDGIFSQRPSDGLAETVRNLCWCQQATADGAKRAPDRGFLFDDAGWWFARDDPSDPDGLAVAAKAGSNDEPHNHNDCGSFVVHYGGESSITDIGVGTYDRDYFSDHRYEYLTARSLGHPVPLVNGYEQAAGPDYTAEIVDRVETDDRERFDVELAECYPSAAGVSSLRRSFVLERTATRLTVTDQIVFDSDVADPDATEVFVSYAPMTTTGDGRAIAIDGTRTRTTVSFDPAPAAIEVEHLPDAIDFSTVQGVDTDVRDVWRARITPATTAGDEPVRLETTVDPESLD
ncbi:heparinase II/III family protein [Saliphagus sp. LR7]|uniref:heparinase II/III domain-containing protein n=1 Tax=Saliphagus sp. LR7 TaxID=2282654 RepID=UPI0013009F69|nr:heparinase II/III family protein [Saliphagus sp. LR7]